MPIFRRGEAGDIEAIAAIQAASPDSAKWDAAGYLSYSLLVAEISGQVAGFLVWRAIDGTECELLNLAVVPEFRRQGVARGLLEELRKETPAAVFLEVRESNLAARSLYKSFGFQEVSVRRKYYDSPPESGIVMKLHS